MNGNGFNNSYSGYMNNRGMSLSGGVTFCIILLVGGLVAAAVLGLMRNPIETAQAAGIMVGVACSEAELVADTPQMPAVSAAEAQARIAQIYSESQTRALYDETTRRNISAEQQHREALAAEQLAHTQDMHQIYERLAMGSGVTLIMLVGLGAGWYFYTEINSRLAVQVAARSAQAAQAQLAAAQAVAAAQTLAAARPAVSPATVATPTRAPSPARPVRPTRPEPISGRLPELPTGQPQRERPTPTPRPAQPQPAQPRPAPAPAAVAVTNIPPHRWLETIGHGNGAYPNGNGPNGHSPNGNYSNGNGYNGRGR